MHRPCDIKDNAASLVCATAATKSSQPVPANRSNSPPFIYRRATKSTNHRSVKFLDGVQALRGWDGTMIALSASVSTSSEARCQTTAAGCLVKSCGPVSSSPSESQLQIMSLWRFCSRRLMDSAERADAERELEHRLEDERSAEHRQARGQSKPAMSGRAAASGVERRA